MWAHAHDESLDDIFGIQTAIAVGIAAALSGRRYITHAALRSRNSPLRHTIFISADAFTGTSTRKQ